jgi:F-box/leucine-rich repeat protein 2/20
LDIGDCYEITDAGIRALASGCTQLQSLNIGDCYEITDEGIRAVASGCPQLRSLDIGDCDNIFVTDAGREIAERINSRGYPFLIAKST